jgi:hypothetical protein
MKLLLILASDKNYEILLNSVTPLGFELIRYKHVLKAMDNIDEIDPTAIVISASDFPRHWKTIVQFVRSERSKENTPIVVLRGGTFLLDDANKAFYLGVNGIVSENLDEPMEIDRLQSLLSRYVPVKEKRKAKRFKLDKKLYIEFMFTHPGNNNIVTGKVKDISATGISFQPDQSDILDDLSLSAEILDCSLRIGLEIISPVCRIVHLGENISLEFAAFSELEEDIMKDYIEKIPLLQSRGVF